MITKSVFRLLILLYLLSTARIHVYAQKLMVLYFEPDPKGMEITWIPVSDSIWEAGLAKGYEMRRIELGTDLTQVQTRSIGTAIYPQSMQWFIENENMESGMIGALGKILYDTTHVEDIQLKGESWNIRYRYVAYEARLNAQIAQYLGLGILDTTGVEGTKYKYEIYLGNAQDGNLLGSQEIIYGNSFFQDDTNDKNPTLDIYPPNGVPLSAMRSDFGKFNRIESLAKAYGDSIILRWAPNNPLFWNASNNAGYYLFREEAVRDTNLYSPRVGYILLDSIKPWTLNVFSEKFLTADSMVLIAAQCLYGNSSIKPGDDLLTQSSELDMRYGMAMLAADKSPQAANSLGLRYVDRKVSRGESYRYLLYTNASTTLIENAIIEVENKIDSIQRITNVFTDSLDHIVSINWDKSNNSIFSGYIIERSDNGGKTFSSITSAPLLFVENPESKAPFNSFTDSIPQNYKPYYYRISGVDAFGDWSEPVEVVGMGIDLTPPPPPVMILAQATLEGVIQLKWEMPERAEDLKYIHVLLSDHLDGEYAEVASRLPVSAREYVFPGPLNTMRSYYFRLSAEDDKGNRSTTLSYYVHLVDSIAPASPEKLEYRVDSSGIVTLVWEHGDEPDLLGYRVYVANNPNHEFAQLTKEPTPLNAWLDTLNLGLLDKEIYYRVVAEDRSHNLSPFSEILPVQRPDIIPPAAPVLLPIAADMEGIRLRWSPSPSNDLAGYILLRKIEQDSVYYPVRLIGADTTSWHDTTALPEVLYEYSIQAMDESGLLSELSFPLKARRMLDLSLLGVERLLLTYNTKDTLAELQWIFRPMGGAIPKDTGYLFYLYKKKDADGWSKLKQFNADISGYKDADIKQPGKYAYAIKVVRLDGRSGVLAESGWIEVVGEKK